jgi:hypothetical protein
MDNQANKIRVVNHRKNGEEFDPAGFVLPLETTAALIEAITLPGFVFGSSKQKPD